MEKHLHVLILKKSYKGLGSFYENTDISQLRKGIFHWTYFRLFSSEIAYCMSSLNNFCLNDK